MVVSGEKEELKKCSEKEKETEEPQICVKTEQPGKYN